MEFYDFAKFVVRQVVTAIYAARISGAGSVPKQGPLVVAANHRSYLDVPILGALFPRTIHFMGKRELFEHNVFVPLLRGLHGFPVDRQRFDLGSIRHALKLLRRGEVVGMFPEGRRNLDGEARARGGAVMLAATARCPVVPVALVGTDSAARRLRASKVEVRVGEPLTFQGSAQKPTKSEIEHWTDQLSAAIVRLSGSQRGL